jgi:hypothetical protein
MVLQLGRVVGHGHVGSGRIAIDEARAIRGAEARHFALVCFKRPRSAVCVSIKTRTRWQTLHIHIQSCSIQSLTHCLLQE